ncbi:CRISPR-associated protein Cas5 [Synechocystis sp. PCC 7338]|uniref:CRISPR-associated protein Cas5 n=1 Tax=Synechocystis sp. PCC 7338 TaxID=2732530 RepID=UPI001BB002DA|nr:CRISPR-associated protein Cas5 [Synechocystis sp. PCC 7338]QUS60093.1 CRISPR-associated protein Cas5 [Synechocystis sp. PCC 7338]
MINLFYLDCPCTNFPRSFARDYKETYLYPPPSTVYGFLLSLVGEENLTAHLGVKIAIGLIGDPPPISRIVRKQRHHKFSKQRLGSYPSSKFSKPNHQELLTDLKVALKVDSSGEKSKITLADRVAIAVSTPEEITRFGGLSLGESWAMVNGIRPYRPEDGDIRWLMKDNRGLIGLPVWIDRKTTQGTFQRFTLEKMQEFRDAAWITIKANH